MPADKRQKAWRVGLKTVYHEKDLPDPKDAAAPSVAPPKAFDSRKPPGGKLPQKAH